MISTEDKLSRCVIGTWASFIRIPFSHLNSRRSKLTLSIAIFRASIFQKAFPLTFYVHFSSPHTNLISNPSCVISFQYRNKIRWSQTNKVALYTVDRIFTSFFLDLNIFLCTFFPRNCEFQDFGHYLVFPKEHSVLKTVSVKFPSCGEKVKSTCTAGSITKSWPRPLDSGSQRSKAV